MSAKTAVVILNWNGRKFLNDFLPSVVSYSGDAEIIVADNASTDDSVELVQSKFPTVKMIRNSSNKGFTGGYNEALQKVNAKYFVLLNSDVEVSADWLSPLEKLMESDESIAACQPKILSYAQKDSFEYAGAGGGYLDRIGFPFCRGRILFQIEKDNGQFNDCVPVFWATGACMMIRSEVYHQLNGLDENFFAHMEEIDLCWRIHSIGKKVYYCGESAVYHVGGGTLAKNSPKKTYLNFRNNLLMLYKNNTKNDFRLIFRRRFPIDMLAAVKFLFFDGYMNFTAVLKAYRDFFKLKAVYKSKRPLQRSSEAYSFIYSGSILWEYYLWGRKKFSSLKRDIKA